ncbi:alanine racemase [Oceanivirga miroungae]|uniref:Alanine racemase n=1 Tax=Oceanivirga miroungae TaxID=1130046 RepID=A0A6I8MA66_9FUSO|nr:alanine racemase [Oceanivirga miroungae]VWL85072.1 hypothetical protein OMES3154_00354 [Oceanivirga miroungae]
MRAYAKINLDKLIDNVKKVSDIVSKEKIMAVVKANAYGHGDIQVVKKLIEFGIRTFAVATFLEAKRLSEKYKEIDILILGEIEKNQFKEIENTNILISISNIQDLKYIQECGLKNRVHLKLDTGMNRLGFLASEIEEAKKYIGKINIEGIFTHLSSVESDEEFTKKQIDIFLEATKDLKIKKHILNSAGIKRYECYLDYVRLGIDMYTDVMSLYTKVVHIHSIKKGEKVGYDGTFVAKKDTKIATVSIGYADGYKRGFSNKVEVEINSRKYKQVGNVCMDLMMVEVDDNVKVGDIVTLFKNNKELMALAKIADTITYEIFTSISLRVDRIYEENKALQ